MQNSSSLKASKLTIVMLVMVMLICCSGGPVPPPPPQGPSGIITAAPVTSASAPFAITIDSSQEFTVSEAGYSGVFWFGGSYVIERGRCGGPYTDSAQSFTAPAGTSVALSKSTGGSFGYCEISGASYAVTVKDSLGNSTTIYTD